MKPKTKYRDSKLFGFSINDWLSGPDFYCSQLDSGTFSSGWFVGKRFSYGKLSWFLGLWLIFFTDLHIRVKSTNIDLRKQVCHLCFASIEVVPIGY